MEYELKTRKPNGKTVVVTFVADDGPSACERYADLHRDHVVIAWREPRIGIRPLGDSRQIIG